MSEGGAMERQELEGKRPKGREVLAVPGALRLAWLLFMKPITLHRWFNSLGLVGDPSWWKLRYALEERNPIVVSLLGSVVFLQVMSIGFAGGMVAVLGLCGYVVQWDAWARGVGIGIAFGAIMGVVFSVVRGTVFGASSCVCFGVAIGVNLGTASPAIAIMCFILANRSIDVFRRGTTARVTFEVRTDVVVGIVVGVVAGWTGSMIDGVALASAWVCFSLRLPLWLLELLVSFCAFALVRLFPTRIVSFWPWLPMFHDELISLPIPGLRSVLLDLADRHPILVLRALFAAADSPGLRRSVSSVTTELRARDLERSARDRLFERLAAFDLPWLPTPNTLPDASPFVAFHHAARDLAAGGTNHHHRRRALDRARRTIDAFHLTTPPAEERALHARLLITARLWRDVIDDELRRLARDAQDNPQVPAVFVAGTALDPALPDAASLFKGRRDVSHEIEHDLAPDRRGVIVLTGQRRMGKSSLAKWLPRLLGTAHVVTVDFQQLSGSPLRATPHRIVIDAVAATPALTPPSPPPASDAWRDALDWLRALDATLGDRPMLVVVDEIERLQNGIEAGWCSTDFLDFLRAAGDALSRIRFLVMTAYPLARLGLHWVDRLVSVTPRAITYLDEADARELLVRPIADFPDIYPPGGVDRILRETGCHPFLVQKVGYELCQRINLRRDPTQRQRATDDDLTRVFEAVLDAEIPFAELWRQRTPDERAALSRIAAEGPAAARTPLLRLLEREGYLREREGALDIAVPLFEEWIATRALTSPEASGDAAG